VELHPDTAASRGIQDKEEVVVESPKGCITSIAKLNEKLDPRVVSVPYGWGHKFGGAWQLANSAEGESVNYLIDDALFDKISGTPNYRSAVCEVRKKL
jgi:anaerobic selenocysteine-containing dehydrogenase